MPTEDETTIISDVTPVVENTQPVETSDSDQPTGTDLFVTKVGEELNQGQPAQFDPMTILLLLTVIMPLLKNCLPTNLDRLRVRIGNRAIIASALKKSPAFSDKRLGERLRLADAILDAANKSSDDELRLFLKDCCG